MSIKAGDKVMLVWACCSPVRLKYVGWIGSVLAVEETDESSSCRSCGHHNIDSSTTVVKIPAGEQGVGYVPPSWLIKLPPDSEIKQDEEELVKLS